MNLHNWMESPSFFHFYCNTPEYIEAVANGVERVDLK